MPLHLNKNLLPYVALKKNQSSLSDTSIVRSPWRIQLWENIAYNLIQLLWIGGTVRKSHFCSPIFLLPRRTVYPKYIHSVHPHAAKKPLASYQCSSWAVSRKGHDIRSKDWKTLTAKERLSANVFPDVNPGELMCENERTSDHIWGGGLVPFQFRREALFRWLVMSHNTKLF